MLEKFATTETANVVLQTLGTNSMTLKCKLDLYLMFTMFKNCATAETANVLLQNLGTSNMIAKCKLNVYLMATMLENCAAPEMVTILFQILGTNSMIVKGKLDVNLMSTMFENCASTKTAKVSLQTLETKSMHSYTAVWCTSKLIPVSPIANKKIDVYTRNILTKEGTNYHLSLHYRVTMSGPRSKQVTLTTLDVYKWTLAAHFLILWESVRSDPKVVRILTTMWAVSIIFMSVVYTATIKPYNHKLNSSPGHRLSSNNLGNVQTTPRTLDVYDSRTNVLNKDTRKQISLDKACEFSNRYLETVTLTLAVKTRRNERVILTDVLSSTECTESQIEKEPLIRQQKDLYKGQALDKNNEADGQLKADITHKTKKKRI